MLKLGGGIGTYLYRLSENEISRWLSCRLAGYYVVSRDNAKDTDTNRVLFLDKKESALIARIKTDPFILYSPNLEQESSLFESVIDGMVYELYFSSEIKAADCDVLKNIAKLPEFKDDWNDEKKLHTIEKVYKELSDSKHPVSMAMAKMQGIPEIKLIEGKR